MLNQIRVNINKEDILKYINGIEDRKKSLLNCIKRFLNQKNFGMVGFNYGSLVGCEKDIALEKYALGEPISEVKKHFRKAAEYAEELANLSIKTNEFYQRHLSKDAIYSAIISNDLDLAKRIVMNIKSHFDLTSFDDEIHLFSLNTTDALRNFILGKNEKAIENISNIKVYKDKAGIEFYYQGQLYKAVMEKDEALFDDNLGKLLQRHYNQVRWGIYKNISSRYFSIPAVAISKLAKQRGLEIKIEQIPEKLRQYLPMELIE